MKLDDEQKQTGTALSTTNHSTFLTTLVQLAQPVRACGASYDHSYQFQEFGKACFYQRQVSSEYDCGTVAYIACRYL